MNEYSIKEEIYRRSNNSNQLNEKSYHQLWAYQTRGLNSIWKPLKNQIKTTHSETGRTQIKPRAIIIIKIR